MYIIILLLWNDAFLLKSIKALLMESSAFIVYLFWSASSRRYSFPF
jgi:hypothetical protein